MNRFSTNTLKSIQWLCGQALKNAEVTFEQYSKWYSKNLRGGQQALKETWRDLYNARIVDTMNPNDSYIFQGRP